MTKVPCHIGFIMDGNRRFAKRLMMHPTKGHEWGAKKIWNVFEWCKEAGVREMTFYTLSTENFDRPKKEFEYLMNLFRQEIDKILTNERLLQEGICIRFIGRTFMLPEKLQQRMQALTENTKHHQKFLMNFAIAYGGRSELADAARRIAEAVQTGTLEIPEITEKVLSENLYISSEPDMIIRTGGEHRTSNFLPFQSAYSEWFFLDTLWPEFEEGDFKRCLLEFKNRERRRGK